MPNSALSLSQDLPPFSSSPPEGYSFWFDGSDASSMSLSGNQIISWDNKGSIDTYLNQSNSSYRFTFDSSENAVSCSGGVFMSTPTSIWNTNGHDIYVVCKPTANSENDIVGAGSLTSGGVLLMLYSSKLRGHFWHDSGLASVDSTTIISTNQKVILRQRVSSNFYIYINNNSEGSTGIAAGDTTLRSLIIGSRSGSASANFNGWIYDILIYPSENNEAIAYLKTKHGIA